MRNAAPVLAFWGLLLAVLGAVAALFFAGNIETPALLGGAASLAFAGGGLLGISGLGRQRVAPHASPEHSPPTVWLAAAVALACLGAELGLWLALIGAGMGGAGIGGIARELRAQRRAAGEVTR